MWLSRVYNHTSTPTFPFLFLPGPQVSHVTVVSLLLLWVGKDRVGCLPAVYRAPLLLPILLSMEGPRGSKTQVLVLWAPKGEERKLSQMEGKLRAVATRDDYERNTVLLGLLLDLMAE